MSYVPEKSLHAHTVIGTSWVYRFSDAQCEGSCATDLCADDRVWQWVNPLRCWLARMHCEQVMEQLTVVKETKWLFFFFLLVFVPVHLHTGGHRALLIHKFLMNKFPCGILKPVYLRVCRILIKKMTAVHSRRKCDASVSFKLAVAFERTCQLQVFCSAAILHVFLPGHVTSVFFFLFYWIFRSYTLCGFLLDWGAFWQWATQYFVPPDSQLYLGNTCVRDLLLASSRPVIRAFWNSVARAEDLLETNTSLLWETDIVIVGIFGTVSSCDHHCNCLVVELGACACEAFSLATDVLVDFFFFPVNESTLLYSVLALLLRALYVMSTR